MDLEHTNLLLLKRKFFKQKQQQKEEEEDNDKQQKSLIDLKKLISTKATRTTKINTETQ